MKVQNHMAILRNLRNIQEAGIDNNHMEKLKRCFTHESWVTSKILPFRFIAAARFAVNLEPWIEKAMFKCLNSKLDNELSGKTILLVDVSGSMDSEISDKSTMMRMDAAAGLAVLMKKICEDVRIFSFSNETIEIPNRIGFALRDAIVKSQAHSGTYMQKAIAHAVAKVGKHDRIVIFTDEQSCDVVKTPPCEKAYVVNVGSYKNGVGYGKWIHIDGFSEAIIDYIHEVEKFDEINNRK